MAETSKTGPKRTRPILKQTRPERLLWQALSRLGMWFEAQPGGIFGRPDFRAGGPDERIAVFVDGEFWHGMTERSPQTLFWRAKIFRNVRRDALVTERLTRSGWVVLRFSEQRIYDDAAGCAAEVEQAWRAVRKEKKES